MPVSIYCNKLQLRDTFLFGLMFLCKEPRFGSVVLCYTLWVSIFVVFPFYPPYHYTGFLRFVRELRFDASFWGYLRVCVTQGLASEYRTTTPSVPWWGPSRARWSITPYRARCGDVAGHCALLLTNTEWSLVGQPCPQGLSVDPFVGRYVFIPLRVYATFIAQSCPLTPSLRVPPLTHLSVDAPGSSS